MTTSGPGSESSAEPPAEAGAGGTVPENEQELRQEIEQTRERLGDTVELLVAKTDIKGRAQAKVAGLAGASTARQGWVPLAVVAALLALGSGYSGYLAFRPWEERRPG